LLDQQSTSDTPVDPQASETASQPSRRPRLEKRILFVINSLAGGGAERVFTTILNQSQQRLAGYDVHVALLDRDPPAFHLPAWATVHQLDCGHRLLPSILRLAKLARDLRPEVLVSFLTRSNVAAVIAGRVAGSPVVISERNDTSAQLSHSRAAAVARLIVRLTYPRANHVIAVSAGIAGALHEEYTVDPRRISVINNPVDIEAITLAASAPPPVDVAADDVVMLARLEPQKALDVAIRAFARSARPGRLIILGEGSERSQLRQLGDRLGLGARLVMPGYVDNPHAVVARASLLLLSSRHEGFCNALLEAMAIGVPVVASDCRFSPSEILQATAPAAGEVSVGTGGLLVRVDDEIGFARALRMIPDQQELTVTLKREARVRARDFESSAQLKRYLDLICRFADDREAADPELKVEARGGLRNA
jgi:glycosyltransferase involved in cell wall biosynthesis